MYPSFTASAQSESRSQDKDAKKQMQQNRDDESKIGQKREQSSKSEFAISKCIY